MKKLILVLLLGLSLNVSAETYAGFYGIKTNTITSTTGSFDENKTSIAFGQNTNGLVGLGYELFFNGPGLGGLVNVFAKNTQGYRVSLGMISIPDSASRPPVENWPISQSNNSGQGAVLGLSFPLSENKSLSVKYIRYDVDHSFYSSKKTGVDNSGNDIITRKSGFGSAEREQLWVGVTFKL